VYFFAVTVCKKFNINGCFFVFCGVNLTVYKFNLKLDCRIVTVYVVGFFRYGLAFLKCLGSNFSGRFVVKSGFVRGLCGIRLSGLVGICRFFGFCGDCGFYGRRY